MANDEHGMLIPKKDDPHFRAKILTFRYAVYQTDDHLDWSTSDCESMANYAFAMAKENQECREIVRRLEEWGKKYPKGTIHSFKAEKEHDAIESDAARLWAKMQREVGDGE